MIAKINTGSSIYGALAYNMDKMEEQEATVIHTSRMMHDPACRDIISMDRALLSFEPYLAENRQHGKTRKPVVHISINPSIGDNLSDGQYRRIVDDYMEKLGYGNQPYIVFRHNDIDREHIHVVTVNVDEYGKKIGDSYQKRRSEGICRELELKYGLRQVGNEKSEEYRQYIKPVDYRKGDIKRQMSNTIRSIIDGYSFQSLGEYNALLSCFNIQSKYVKGLDNDNLYHGIVYSTTDNQGNYIGNRIKSSRLGKFAGYNALTKAMLKTKKDIQELPVPYKAKNIIAKAKAESGSIREFTGKLKEHKIDVFLRYNEEGRLYGVTFIDHKDRIAFNGSRIGKQFSANAMNDWFNTLPDTQQSIKPETGGIQGKPALPGGFSPAFLENVNRADHSYDDNSIGDMFGTFHVTAGTPDPEEEAFIRRMKRKKKKGRGRKM